ncbi:Agmatine deiminase [hydrothermal vent metagenome]|uniref:Agmatine deiminase n=1 Tax=hydrothermal vent metagenome TaxID=652676 RepID=A0A3B0YNZ1_9ZZZZ
MTASELRLPAEWEPQAGIMLTWPHTDSDWRDHLSVVEPVFLRIATEIAKREILLVNCFDEQIATRIHAHLHQQNIPQQNLVTAILPSDDSWARDHAPLTRLRDEHPELLDFTFNGWGNKYPAERDNAINRYLADAGVFGDTPFKPIDLVLEGGSIDSDGAGTLLTTRRCLMNPKRNPGLDDRIIEEHLGNLLGVKRVLWLENSVIEGDDTDGHIDMLARFVETGHIVYQHCNEPDYSAYANMQAMEAELRELQTIDGKPYRLTPLPWPSPKHNEAGMRLPASYANFLIINGAVLIPAYEDAQDDVAAELLKQCFPDRTIVQIPCLPLIQQFGSLHCVTMQFPAGVELRPANPG